MQYVCDGPDGKTWFRIETEGEAAQESDLMGHAVEKYFRQARDQAAAAYAPPAVPYIEQEIGLSAHLRRTMPIFLTLRDQDGNGLATAMLPPEGSRDASFRPIIVGPRNGDPYPREGAAIEMLASHFGLRLDRARCFPYSRS